MSDLYEAVVSITDSEKAHAAFRSLDTHLHLRLARLSDELFAIYRVATRDEPFDDAMHSVAAQLSISCGQCLAMSYDLRCGMSSAHRFRGGSLVESFGEDNELWVLLDEDGYPLHDGERYTVDQLDDNEEYDCIHTGVDAGLLALGVGNPPSLSALIQAFCYDELDTEGEHTTAQ